MLFNSVAVLGGNGTMGSNVAGIFASFGQAKVFLFARDIDKAKKAKDKICKSVRSSQISENLIPCDYSEIEKIIPNCDLVFESVSENYQTKEETYKLINKYLNEDTVVCTGTSGLSIEELSKYLPIKNQDKYFGMHMFNPPYSMPLCELILTDKTNNDLVKQVKDYLENILFRKIVVVKDEPGFLANRIGFLFINYALILAEEHQDKGGIDFIDQLLGTFTGRLMPLLVTADFVGLDIHQSIVDNLYENTADYMQDFFKEPDFVRNMVENKILGRKTNKGLYFENMVFDIKEKQYRPVVQYEIPFINKMKELISIGKYKEAYDVLNSDSSLEANICREFLNKYIEYSLFVSKQLCGNIESCDEAMAYGFNWCPPLALNELLNSEKKVKSKYDYRSYIRTV